MAKRLRMAKKMTGKGKNGFIDLGEGNMGCELPAKAAKKGITGQRARLAQTLRGMHSGH